MRESNGGGRRSRTGVEATNRLADRRSNLSCYVLRGIQGRSRTSMRSPTPGFDVGFPPLDVASTRCPKTKTPPPLESSEELESCRRGWFVVIGDARSTGAGRHGEPEIRYIPAATDWSGLASIDCMTGRSTRPPGTALPMRWTGSKIPGVALFSPAARSLSGCHLSGTMPS